MTYKMFICDLDGTLLDDNHKISTDNIRAIKVLQDKGIKFVVATGRTKHMLEDYLESIDYKGPFIWSNGAAISDIQGKDYLARKIEVEDSKKLLKLAEQYEIDYVLYTLDGMLAQNAKGRIKAMEAYNLTVKKEHRTPLKVDKLLYSNIDKYEVIKYVFTSNDRKALEVFQKAINETMDDISAVFSYVNLLDVMSKGTSKGRAVLKLAKHYKIKPEEIIVIGDNENDLSMLEIGGLPITLDNAIDQVKEVAAYITKDNNSSGVAEAIEKYIL